jgi:ferredoxin
MTRVAIDRSRCVGAGQCSMIAPDVFELGDDGKSALVGGAPDDDEAVALAADLCPARAISTQP